MEIQSILLAAILLVSIPVVAAYLYFLRKSTSTHLDVLVASDRNATNQDSLMRTWKLNERRKFVMGGLVIALLLVWSAIQILLGPDGKSTLDTVLSLAFALPLSTAVVAATHYDILDSLNSYGLGQRAELRLAELYPAS